MVKGFRRSIVLVAALVGAAIALTVPSAGLGSHATADASCQLSVFSWWTGGGEAAGLDKLIKIWNKAHPKCQFKNETVAGGAGSNAKAVLAQRLKAGNPPDSFQGHAGAELRDYIKAGQVGAGRLHLQGRGLRQGHARVSHQPDQVQRQAVLGPGEHPPGECPLVQPEDAEGERDHASRGRGHSSWPRSRRLTTPASSRSQWASSGRRSTCWRR